MREKKNDDIIISIIFKNYTINLKKRSTLNLAIRERDEKCENKKSTDCVKLIEIYRTFQIVILSGTCGMYNATRNVRECKFLSSE